MATVILIIATLLAQGDTTSPKVEPTYRILVSEDASTRIVYGVIVTAVPRLDEEAETRVITVRPDEPWEPSPKTETLREGRNGNISSMRVEPPAEREVRIRDGFEERGLVLVGADFANPRDWVPKSELTYAERARDMVLKAEADAAAAESAAAILDQPDRQTPSRRPMMMRLAQIGVAVAALVLVALVAKTFLF